jgi:hypothetical protein
LIDAAGAAPVKGFPRFAGRSTPPSEKVDDSGKMRFLFFRLAIKIGVLKESSARFAEGDVGGSHPLRHAGRRDSLAA